jgi:GDPmannose 4,6-dehydratase
VRSPASRGARRALVTGASGQDGYYLSRLLRERGTEVLAIDRAAVSGDPEVRVLDVTDRRAMRAVIEEFAPHEFYHLAAYHRSSAVAPELSDLDEEREYVRVNFLTTQDLLHALRELCPSCRLFLAGSCHMFGAVQSELQDEATPFVPNSAYGITKVASWHLAKMYRERGLLFCSMGILYNHESPRRGPGFVTTRIAQGVAEIVRKERDHLVVGNLAARVDWGFAGDYVEAMWRMLQHDEADDFVVASGALHRVQDFIEIAFGHVGLDWRAYVREDAGVHRAVHAGVYHGDTAKIRAKLGWRPATSFEQLVRMMVDHHLASPSASQMG